MGNGFNYVREIMQMNLPDTPDEKAIRAFRFIGDVAEMPGWSFDRGRRVVRVVNHQKMEEWISHAAPGDVIRKEGKLYSWTYMGWCEFTPGPCTIYDGPRPEPAKKYKYMYDLRYPFTQGDKDVCIIARADGGWNHWEAKIGEAYMYDGNFYTWTGKPDGWILIDKSLVEGYNKEEKENMATEIRYLGEAQSAMRNGLKGPSVMIKGIWERARNLDLVLSGDVLYCYVENKNEWARISTIAFTEKVQYNKIPYGFLAIKNVVFNDPATIVLWEDGTKTVVKCGEDEEFDWEKGLAMAIAKKAFGNEGNYYNQIKKWKPETEENDGLITLTLSERLNRVFGDPRIADAKKKLAAVQDLICDMTFNGATKVELVRTIKYSKDLIDFCKGVDVDIDASAERYGIVELEAKYQPK